MKILNIRVNGNKIREMALELKSGKIILGMKASGAKIKHLDKVSLHISMVTHMKVNGPTTWLTVAASTSMPMELTMMESGLIINNMDKAVNFGWTEQNIKVIILMARRRAKEHFISQMDLHTTGNSIGRLLYSNNGRQSS